MTMGDAVRYLVGLAVFAVLMSIAIDVTRIADAQIALASEGCYEVPEASYTRR